MGTTTRSADNLVLVDAKIARDMERRQRYESRNPGRRTVTRNSTRGARRASKLFCCWDGEGPRDAGYALFGSSMGDEICHPFLGTEECFALMMEREKESPDVIHMGFGLNYDFSMILKDLSWNHLNALKIYNKTFWHGYDIEVIPGKWMKIHKDGLTVKLFDFHSFFGTSYITALTNFKVGPWNGSGGQSSASRRVLIAHSKSESLSGRILTMTALGHGFTHNISPLTALTEILTEPEIIALFKAERADFLFKDIQYIKHYMRLELKYMPDLCEKLRTAFEDAGFKLNSWHGPGALASLAMKMHKVYDAKAVAPVEIRPAIQWAFAGGRFEQFRGGYIRRTLYTWDINSCYPYYAATCLPNLARGTWRRTKKFEAGKFAVYHIRYESEFDARRCYPLFRRTKSGIVCWPNKVEGWYWAPEAELVADDADAAFLEGWVFDEEDEADRPFAFLREYYYRRLRLKRMGNHMEYTLKLIINSIYGQLAMVAGWDKKKGKAPKNHQLEWAGYITSACRAQIFKAALMCGDELISIDTDAVTTTRKIDLEESDELGGWEKGTYTEGVFWQSGIYGLASDIRCTKPDIQCPVAEYAGPQYRKGKTRGLPRGQYKPAELIRAMETNEPLHLRRKMFIGYNVALMGQHDKLNTWKDDYSDIVFGGEGKRFHNPVACKHVCKDGIHIFMPKPLLILRDNCMSLRHSLPWVGYDPGKDADQNIVDDLLAYEPNNMDEEEMWRRNYVS